MMIKVLNCAYAGLTLNNNILNFQYHWHGKHLRAFEVFWSQEDVTCVHVTSVEKTSVLCVIFVIFW